MSLDGLQGLAKLRVLYCSNNKIKDWSELDKLVRRCCWIQLVTAARRRRLICAPVMMQYARACAGEPISVA